MSNIAIQAEGLSKQFGNIRAVDNISFQVNRGDVFGFLGPNGAGKTTTIGMLLGLVTPTSGNGTIFGNSILSDQPLIKPKIGAIIENPSFYPYLSGFDNLKAMYFASGLKPDLKVIKEKLELVGLGDRAKSKFKAYSLGMKQRLGLASILLTDPDLIFLDEPTNGLDPAGQKEIRELIISLAKNHNKTIFISSHQLMEIEKICNRVAIVKKGKIIETGNTQELLSSGQGVYLQVENAELCRNILSSKSVRADLTGERNFNLFIHIDFNLIPEILKTLVESNCQIFAVEPHKRSLEDLFLELTEVKG